MIVVLLQNLHFCIIYVFMSAGLNYAVSDSQNVE